MIEEIEFEGPPEPPKSKLEWEYKTEFGINTKMRDIIEATIKVAEASVDEYKRKIDRLTYGS